MSTDIIGDGYDEVNDTPVNELITLNVYGILNNFDDAYIDDITGVETTANLAQANFQRNIAVGGDIHMGTEITTTDPTTGVTTITDSGGSIIFKRNGVVYTITRQKLSYLVNLSSDVQEQFNNLSNNYLTTTSLAGNLTLGTTYTNTLTINSTANFFNGFYTINLTLIPPSH